MISPSTRSFERDGLGIRVLLGVAMVLCAGACGTRKPAPGDTPTTLRTTILGDARDPRLPAVREALAHWNAEAARLELHMRMDSGTLVRATVSDNALQAASRAVPWGGVGVLRLRAALADVPGDIVIALSQTDLVSFGVSSGTGRTGIIALRLADRWPLSLPNTLRNVVAHELGHVLGLAHNADSTTLMCGRPARCRPTAFASERAHFFPLTLEDEQKLRQRWH